MFLIFLECVKITSVGLQLDRPHLKHWLLFLEHNRSENSNVVACLYLYLWAMTVFMIQFATPPVLVIFSDAGSSSCRI